MGQENRVSIGKTEDDSAEVEILYMRLEALQSMKEKLDEDEDEEMVEEMEELLHEADQAANEMDSMSNVVKRLKEAAKRQEPGYYSPTQSDHYSPTQSPLKNLDHDPIDLDLINPSSPPPETEEITKAEVQFFKAQREEPLFPSSVWEFQPPKNEVENNLEAFHLAVMEQSNTVQKFRRKRARKITEESEEKALRAAVLSSMAEKRTKKIEETEAKKRKIEEDFKKKQKIEKDLKSLKEELEKLNDKSVKNKIEAMPLSRKHFPNLFLRRVIIPGKDLLEIGPPKEFVQNLDNLMKDLRSKTKVLPKKAPPKPIRKFPPGPASAKKAVIKKVITSTDKEILKKSNISHLPPDKQAEYKKLLAILAKKEKEPAPKLILTKDYLTKKEADLIKVRQEMTASLYKLSAEVSQLKQESSKKETAEAFLEKLMKQVATTQELISKKSLRINKLKNVVRQSHQEIVAKSKAIGVLKKECKTIGMTVQGQDYNPPQQGMDMIRKKLSVIHNSAKVVNKQQKETEKKQQSETESSDSSDSESSSSSEDEQKPLAHLKKSVILDPQVEFCRFDLLGRCNDESCPYQHHRPS